ncbi:hypothetical protein Ari01nite_06610 [Paractinoplanes rishiriensis]|uniref:Uncharacterized protein n=1 Tax=Paractinoplanes rishiriensis TaxID=1050105 RepID=A0A919JQE1_9ACTN|nr:hypothetical protein Ari01nite_06610 [Actinoplanes rishiriensis]
MIGGEGEAELALDGVELGVGEARRERESAGGGKQFRGGHRATLATYFVWRTGYSGGVDAIVRSGTTRTCPGEK